MERRLLLLSVTLALGGGGVACKDNNQNYIAFDAGPAADVKADLPPDLGPTDSAGGDRAGDGGTDTVVDGQATDSLALDTASTDALADGQTASDAVADSDDDSATSDAENGQ